MVNLAFLLLGAISPPTNLPDVPPGVFNVSTRITINAPLDSVRDVLFDFPSYPRWNPFVRYVHILTTARILTHHS
jgi:uncharacterized membrane protein